MAMIQCPVCGEQISDKAAICVHCGHSFENPKPFSCPDCGAELEVGATICPKCGYPIESEVVNENPQKVEITGVKVSHKARNAAIAIVAAIAIAIVGFFAYNQVLQKKAAEEHEAFVAEYASNLELATYEMLTGAARAETAGNLINKVWRNAIYEDRDNTTDKYTRPNGYFVDDFNTALRNLFSDSAFKSDIALIESNQDTVNALMKELKNPPAEYSDAYEDIKSLYDSYIDLTNLAINPTGSLTSFTSSFNAADTDFSNKYSKMKLNFE